MRAARPWLEARRPGGNPTSTRRARRRVSGLGVTIAVLACLAGTGESAAQPWKSFRTPPYCWNRLAGFQGVPNTGTVTILPVLVNMNSDRLSPPVVDAVEEFRLAIQELVDTHGWTEPVGFEPPARGRPPLVYFGVPPIEVGEPMWPLWRMPPEPGGFRTQVVGADDGSKEWRRAIATTMRRSRVSFAVLLSIRIALYLEGGGITRGQVLLGAGHTRPVNMPADFPGPGRAFGVVLCGAVLDTTGAIVRAAAEGVCISTADELDPRRPDAGWSAMLAARRMLTDVRADLPGHPPAYQVATRNLLHHLIGRPTLLVP